MKITSSSSYYFSPSLRVILLQIHFFLSLRNSSCIFSLHSQAAQTVCVFIAELFEITCHFKHSYSIYATVLFLSKYLHGISWKDRQTAAHSLLINRRCGNETLTPACFHGTEAQSQAFHHLLHNFCNSLWHAGYQLLRAA